jgi:outer membrane protein assembly factor BamB
MSRRGTALKVVLAVALAVVAGADWPQFRGPGLTGIAPDGGLPEQWGPAENIPWKIALPGRGLSSPVVVGGHVYVTACSGLNQTRLHVIAVDARFGIKLWERQFWATGPTNCHPKTCVAAPTPTAAGNRIFALFATGDLVCLDAAGEVCWLRTLQIDHPAMNNLVGRSASPILYHDVLIVPLENQGESWLLGIDAATGRTRWKVERPVENNYSSPLLVKHDGQTDLVIQTAGGLTAYDPADGAKRWEFADEGVSAICSPIVVDGLLLGTGRDMVALRPNAYGPPEVVWRSARLSTMTVTPLAAGDRVYAVKDSGVLTCGDLRTGKELATLRLRGSYSGSPVLAANKLYLTNEDGNIAVVDVEGDPKLIATNRLSDPMLSTPAIARDCLFLRSDKWLYCIGRPAAAK